MHGRVTVIDWDLFVDSMATQSNAPMAVTAAFSRGDLPYAEATSFLLAHDEFRNWITAEFAKASFPLFEVTTSDLGKFEFGSQENPFHELPTDVEIFNNRLYSVDSSGLWSCTAHRQDKKYPLSSRPSRHWDAPLYTLRAKSGRLALAAGEEGLFEYDVRDLEWQPSQLDSVSLIDHRVLQLSKRHCSQADWNFSSVYASSNEDGGFLAAFNWEQMEQGESMMDDSSLSPFDDSTIALQYVGAFDEQDINLGSEIIFSWGGQDKIYSVDRLGYLNSVKFRQAFLGEKYPDGNQRQPFTRISQRAFPRAQEVISGGVAIFGTIVESDDSLTVMESDSSEHVIEGPIVRWRVFPRARRYENQLHVIKADSLDIYAFVGDYEVDQSAKVFGAEYRPEVFRSRRRSFP